MEMFQPIISRMKISSLFSQCNALNLMRFYATRKQKQQKKQKMIDLAHQIQERKQQIKAQQELTPFERSHQSLLKAVSNEKVSIEVFEEESVTRTNAEAWMDKCGFKFVEDKKTSSATLTKITPTHKIEAFFSILPQFPIYLREPNKELEDEEVEIEGTKVLVQVGSNLPEFRLLPERHSFSIIISYLNKEQCTGKLVVDAFSGQDNRLYIDALRWMSADMKEKSKKCVFDKLSVPFQDKFYDYFLALGLDDRVSMFIKQHLLRHYNSSAEQLLTSLEELLTD